MPRFGLGRFKPLVEAKGELATAKRRFSPAALEIGKRGDDAEAHAA
jgi:hypothetical protein